MVISSVFRLETQPTLIVTGDSVMCLISILVRIVFVSLVSVIFGSDIFVIVWLVALFVVALVVVVDVVDDVKGFGFSVVVVFVVNSTRAGSVLFSLFMVSADVAVSVVVDVVVVVVEVVDVVVVVGYETFVSKKLVTWSSTSTNSHDLENIFQHF